MASPVQDWQYKAIDAINQLVTCNDNADAVTALQRVQAHLEARIAQCQPAADPDEDLL